MTTKTIYKSANTHPKLLQASLLHSLHSCAACLIHWRRAEPPCAMSHDLRNSNLALLVKASEQVTAKELTRDSPAQRSSGNVTPDTDEVTVDAVIPRRRANEKGVVLTREFLSQFFV